MKITIGFLRVGLLLCGIFADWCLCLKDVQIKVPATVERGHDAILRCMFDLDGDRLYSVKWYRGNYEFYRYTPSERPPIKQFKIKGMFVREQDSNSTQVVLENVSRDISGSYSCEVTAEQPSFFTDMQTAELQVVDLPQGDPVISGLKPRYRVGETLKANCTSEGSNPAANLTWYLNGKPVDAKYVHRHKPRLNHEDNLLTVHSILRFQVTNHLLKDGRMKIRCTASLHNLYHRISEKSVGREKKHHRHHVLTTSTTMVPYRSWELTQAAKRPPDSTWVFLSPISGESTNKSSKNSCQILYTLTIIIINNIIMQR
ncbi:unnamed protein product [Brassicogethes aeneus]|uniref:Ig-like domain-containing protein n=1 Tax=Brassicogethes aeneus TaxID=1431903 RepID=A0A9P0BJW9_BRAAE|nr:unnamed protein product [Brassicogethes aeneus]